MFAQLNFVLAALSAVAVTSMAATIPHPDAHLIERAGGLHLIPANSIAKQQSALSPNAAGDKVCANCKSCSASAASKVSADEAKLCLRSLLDNYEKDGKYASVGNINYSSDTAAGLYLAYGIFDMPSVSFGVKPGQAGFQRSEWSCVNNANQAVGSASLTCGQCSTFTCA
ncbi:unnamed protein product [Jaminaea pallidilutea]